MNLLHSLTQDILSMPPALAYTVIGLLVFGEAAVFIGFVLPGETAVVLGGVLASQGSLSIAGLIVLVVLCAIVGDSVGYEVGRHFGDRVLRLRPLRRHSRQLDGARGFLRERGGSAVFVGRFTAFLRAVMPGLAGVSKMPYRRFLMWNALGGLVWGTAFCLVGYLAGSSYAKIESVLGQFSAVLLVLVVLAALLVWHRHRKRAEREGGGEAAVLQDHE